MLGSRSVLWAFVCTVCTGVFGCASEGGGSDDTSGTGNVGAPTMPLPGGQAPGSTSGTTTPGSSAPGTGAPTVPPPSTQPPPVGGTPPTGDPATPPIGGDPAGMPPPGTAGSSAPPPIDLPPSGPEDGDPSLPVVSVPGITCGPNPSLLGLTATNTTIGGRAVHVSYPCNKRGGAPVTFILNLHGTMPSEELKLYQVAYFSANNHANTHNFITAAPKAIGSQWGNGDGGKDLPHIMEVIDWVYTTFADFDIRQMWISGHSWGAMYSTTFACDPNIADKVRGAVLESGFGSNPACASRLSVVSTAADGERVIDQNANAASHGCDAGQMGMILNNAETHWPNCNPGFVHANYQMHGKAHADYMDADLVKRIADLIKLARP